MCRIITRRTTLSLVAALVAAFGAGKQAVAQRVQVSAPRALRVTSTHGVVSDTSTSHSYALLPLVMTLGVFDAQGDEKETFTAAPGFELSTGLRLDPHLQLDAALGIAFGAAGISRTIETTLGSRNTLDHETFIMLGGRYIMPSSDESALLSFGGGWVYAGYSEDASTNNETVYCRSCAAQTTGQGLYQVAELDLFFGETKDVGLALSVRSMSVKMNDYFSTGAVRAGVDKPKDTWGTFTAGLVLRF